MKKILLSITLLSSLNSFSAYQCELETPFDGVFHGSLTSTEQESKREAISTCREALGDFNGRSWCTERRVSCVEIPVFQCVLETPFDGDHHGEASTEEESKREAMNACREALGDFDGRSWCKERRISCINF